MNPNVKIVEPPQPSLQAACQWLSQQQNVLMASIVPEIGTSNWLVYVAVTQ